MSKFRSAIVWLVLYTQIWTSVLAQTLPISVDKNVSGQRLIVGNEQWRAGGQHRAALGGRSLEQQVHAVQRRSVRRC
ncbi:hypothetical protein WJ968_08190 [Achromobacter xylosoxidans]